MRTVRIPLTHGKVALIDEEDFERVSKFSWRASWNQGSFYVLRHVQENGKKAHVYLHRYILGDLPDGWRVRHLNRNRLDNRKANLAVIPRPSAEPVSSQFPLVRRAPRRVPNNRLPIPRGDGTSTIQLTKGLVTVIDTADEPLVRHLVWHASKSNTGYYARCSLRGPGQGVQLHRLLLDAPPELQIDHINGDKLDNRRANLRIVTGSENMQNWAAQHFGPDRKRSY